MGKIPVGFYLTGGTALSRAYLNHRYSDDLDFFVNAVNDFETRSITSTPTITTKSSTHEPMNP
jgi:predicted nucleotidyltransferase component of viral defense system